MDKRDRFDRVMKELVKILSKWGEGIISDREAIHKIWNLTDDEEYFKAGCDHAL